MFAKKDAAKQGARSDEPKRVIHETQVDEGEFGITGDLNPEVATIVLSKTDGATTLDTKVLPRAGAKQEEPKTAKQWKTKEELEAEKEKQAQEPVETKEEPKEEPKPVAGGAYRPGALSGARPARGRGDAKPNVNLDSAEEFPTLGAAATAKDEEKTETTAPVASNAWAARGK